LLSGVKHQLGGTLSRDYLRGALAMGDFILQTRDIDVLIVTDRRMDEEAFNALSVLNEQISWQPNPFATRIEAAYTDRCAIPEIRRFVF
jgi:hypothetical protein